MMKERTLRVLEFTKILDMLASFAVTDMGREACEKLTPLSDLVQVNEALEETEEAQVILTYLGDSPLIGFPDVRPYLTLAAKGAALNPKALLSVAECLRASRAARSALVTDRDNTPRITGLASHLQTFRQLEDAITGAIISEEELSDHASPQLADIRRHIKQSNERVREKLNSMVHGASFSKYLQESIVTVRDGRYCIPVKQEYRQFVPGLVHDQSSTGATLFIEPMAVVELGNDLKQWKAKEREEIERILLELSGQVGAQSEMIEGNIYVLTRLDFIFAKGHLSREMNAVLPHMNDQGRIKLVRVRHPLIPSEKVVPCDLWLGQDFTTLIITGPNTGGKTVTLKTVGLLTLMAQAGLHVPGNLGTELSIFEQVYADIGDEQSIEQSLSTFSSHMTNVVSFLDKADRNSLVLFDELGAGTDPTEGAALAIAILSTLHERGIRTMATTHYSELKIYALSTPGVENACCEFDVETLSPTYRLLVGVPGKSNAFAISSKLGLPDYIINKAKDEISEQDESFEDVLTTLEQNRITLEREKEELARTRAEVESLKQSLAKNQEQIDARKEKMISNATEEAQRILREAKEYADQTMRYFQKFGKENVSVREMEQKRTALREKMNKLDKKKAKEVPKRTGNLRPQDLHLGDAVKVLSMNVKGTVSTRPDSKGNLFVQMGIMRTKVHISDLVLIDEAVITGPSISRTSSGKSKLSKAATISTEINLLGKTVDEAVAELDKSLDDAYLSHLPSVRVVHGKGTGALRKGIHNYLRRQKHVADFHLAEFGEGDAGVTIVTFKK